MDGTGAVERAVLNQMGLDQVGLDQTGLDQMVLDQVVADQVVLDQTAAEQAAAERAAIARAVAAQAAADAAARARILAELMGLSGVELQVLWRRTSGAIKHTLDGDWLFWAHAGQTAPAGDWRVWVIRAGRGFGKTRAGAEWVSGIARASPKARIALVGATREDVRRVMIEGEAGLLAVARSDERLEYSATAGEVRFPSGACGYVFAASAPEKLRGPAHDAAWCDELAKWRYGDAAWDNLVLGLRKGDAPRVLVTTTPRPVTLMRRVLSGKDVTETTGRTYDNPHLPDAFVSSVEDLYAGSRLGRQELDGELIDDVEGALWTRAMIEACRVRSEAAPPRDALVRVVVAVDPPAGTVSGVGGDACGIVCVALGGDGLGYVLEDATVAGGSPEGWARAVAACAQRWHADRVVAERNQGGEMVRSVLKAADAALPITLVHASRGKVARAEPVAALYETGRVRHVGAGLGALEDELCGLVVGGAYVGAGVGAGGQSPDRADALIWALTELMLGRRAKAAVRPL